MTEMMSCLGTKVGVGGVAARQAHKVTIWLSERFTLRDFLFPWLEMLINIPRQLGSLEAASKRVEPKLLFEEFDFYSLSFPGLCLAILPAPTTLFSPTPFPSADSWTLTPPGKRQWETMARLLQERSNMRRKAENIPDSVLFKHHTHLSGAYEHWEAMSESDRASAWQLEILRSFTRATERSRQLKSDLDNSQQHVKHLEAEYDRLSRCQRTLGCE